MSKSIAAVSHETAASDGRPRRAGWPVLRVFLLLGVGTGIAVGMLSVALPLYALTLGATPAEVGVLRAISGVGMLIAAVPSGLAIVRFGVRPVFLAGSLGSALSLVACAVAASPSQLGLAMLGEALSRGLLFGALGSAFLHVLPEIGLHRAGWNKGAISLGISFFGPLVAGISIGFLPFPIVFALAAALMALANVALRLVPLPETRAAAAPNRKPDDRAVSAHRSAAHILREPGVLGCLAAEVLLTATFATFATFIIVLAVQDRGLSASWAAFIAAVEGAAYIATAFAGSQRLQRLPTSQAMGIGTLLIVPALAGLSLATKVPLLLVCSVALGVGIGLCTIVITTRAATLAGEKGHINALFMTATSVGAMAGPAFAGAVAAVFGTPAVFLAFVPFFVVLALSIVLKDQTRERLAPNDSTETLTEAP